MGKKERLKKKRLARIERRKKRYSQEVDRRNRPWYWVNDTDNNEWIYVDHCFNYIRIFYRPGGDRGSIRVKGRDMVGRWKNYKKISQLILSQDKNAFKKAKSSKNKEE